MQKEPSIYPYSSKEEWYAEMYGNSESKRLFDEASDWVSGYFAAAQRFGNRSARNSQQTTDIILTRIFDICHANPKLTLEEAASQAMSEFLK